MTRLELFESERHERALYVDIPKDAEIEFPMTRDGLEALAEEIASHLHVIVDDELRNLVCGWVHSFDRSVSKASFQKLLDSAHKSYSNELTFMISEEIKERVRTEKEKTSPALTVVESHEAEANH